MKCNKVKTKQNTTPCCQPAAASCVVNSEPPSIISSSPSSPKLSSPSSFKSSSSSSSSTPMEAAETLEQKYNDFDSLIPKAEPSLPVNNHASGGDHRCQTVGQSDGLSGPTAADRVHTLSSAMLNVCLYFDWPLSVSATLRISDSKMFKISCSVPDNLC